MSLPSFSVHINFGSFVAPATGIRHRADLKEVSSRLCANSNIRLYYRAISNTSTGEMMHSITLLLLIVSSIGVGVFAIRPTTADCTLGGHQVTVDHELTVKFDSSLFLRIPMKTEPGVFVDVVPAVVHVRCIRQQFHRGIRKTHIPRGSISSDS